MNEIELRKKIQELFEELCVENEIVPVIVEGKNDDYALRKVGLNGTILRLNTGLSILNFCEEIARMYNEVIILPDWDKKGKEIFKKLQVNFKPTKIKINGKFWQKFKKYCTKDILEVEDLPRYLDQ